MHEMKKQAMKDEVAEMRTEEKPTYEQDEVISDENEEIKISKMKKVI